MTDNTNTSRSGLKFEEASSSRLSIVNVETSPGGEGRGEGGRSSNSSVTWHRRAVNCCSLVPGRGRANGDGTRISKSRASALPLPGAEGRGEGERSCNSSVGWHGRTVNCCGLGPRSPLKKRFVAALCERRRRYFRGNPAVADRRYSLKGVFKRTARRHRAPQHERTT
jgi:hypothetical protein